MIRRPEMRRACAVAAVVLFALVFLRAGAADAHALSPAMLMLQEQTPGIVDVTWKIPLMRIPGSEIRPVLPPECTPTTEEQISEDSESVTARWRVDCRGASVVGLRVGVDGLALAKTDALLHVELPDGRTIDTVLRASEPFLSVPAPEDRFGVMRRYVQLGFEHIATGYDHLLFVFGLLLLAASTRALVKTITAFTVGHSVTLTLAVLGMTRVPPAPVEVLIALSIFILAVELARAPDAATLMRRAPWLMALTFGFLHGLGFAGTLRATGLPPDAIPLALVSFNIGIEIGQLAFVAAVTVLTVIARPVSLRLPVWSRAVPVYTMGALAAFWMIERALPLVR
jgi:hydrogenase/urease accessory protein HupE